MWIQQKYGRHQELCGLLEKPDKLEGNQTLTIMLSGLGQTKTEKNFMFSMLRKQLGLYQQWAVQFDYRGHGDSEGDLKEATIDSMVIDTLTVIESVIKLHLPTRIFLIGHALGTIVAQKAAIVCEEQRGIQCIPIMISPPLKKLPHSKEILNQDAWRELNKFGFVDVALLAPGEDYITFADFDPDQLIYFTALGAHMVNMHGQFISRKLLEQIDEVDPMDLLSRAEGIIICGEKDTENLVVASSLAKGIVHVMPHVKYFYQHPVATDHLIHYLQSVVINEEKGTREEYELKQRFSLLE